MDLGIDAGFTRQDGTSFSWLARPSVPPSHAALRLICSSQGAGSLSQEVAGNLQSWPLQPPAPCQQLLQHAKRLPSAPQASSSKDPTDAPATLQPKRPQSEAQFEAHKRYRQKKKLDLANLEASHKALLQSYQALQAENTRLHSKARVLEAVMDHHDSMKGLYGKVQRLKYEEDQQQQQQQQQEHEQDQQQQHLHGRSSALAAGSVAADSTTHLCSAASAHQTHSPAVGWGRYPRRQCMEPCASARDVIDHYKNSAHDASGLLLRVEQGTADADVSSQLARIVRDARERLWMWGMSLPEGERLAVCILRHINLDTGVAECAPEEHWAHVLQLLQLSEQQKQDMLGCVAFVEPRLRRVHDRRAQLARQLTQLQQHGGGATGSSNDHCSSNGSSCSDEAGSNSGGCSGSGSGALPCFVSRVYCPAECQQPGQSPAVQTQCVWPGNMQPYEELLQQLHVQLFSDHHLSLQVDEAAVRLLTPIQDAKALVYSLPWMPCWNSMLDMLAKQQQ